MSREKATSISVLTVSGAVYEAVVSLAATHLALCEVFCIDPDQVEDTGWRLPGGDIVWNERISTSLLVKVCAWHDVAPSGVNPKRLTHGICEKCLAEHYPEDRDSSLIT